MKRSLIGLAMGLLSLAITSGAGAAQSYPDAKRIVSVGGPVTEIVFALGAGDRVIARDTTSRYPRAVMELPDVGYMRQLSAEGVLSTGPDLILTRDSAGPPDALDQLRGASVPMVEVADGFTADAVVQSIHTVGEALGVTDRSDVLAARVEDEFAALSADLAAQTGMGRDPVRVLFVLSNQGGRLNVAGQGTGADGIITLAGGRNVMASSFVGYKIMSDESIIAARPDVILMMRPVSETDVHARRQDTMSLPAIGLTPAGQKDGFVYVDPAALGFGPRTAELARQLHQDLLAAVR